MQLLRRVQAPLLDGNVMTYRDALVCLTVLVLGRVSRELDDLSLRLAKTLPEPPDEPQPIVVPRPRQTIIYDVQRLSLGPSGYRFVRGGDA